MIFKELFQSGHPLTALALQLGLALLISLIAHFLFGKNPKNKNAIWITTILVMAGTLFIVEMMSENLEEPAYLLGYSAGFGLVYGSIGYLLARLILRVLKIRY